MSRRILTRSICILLAAVGITLAPFQVFSQGQPRDLDDLKYQSLVSALEAELDDDTENWDEPMYLESLHAIIMDELGDEGDDASEQVISRSALEAEMEEAGTTLDAVVWDALYEADELASLQPMSTWASEFLNFVFPAAIAMGRNNIATRRTGYQTVPRTAANTIKAK